MYKIGFGGNIIEYPQKLLLVINKPVYSAYINFNKLNNKFKQKNKRSDQRSNHSNVRSF